MWSVTWHNWPQLGFGCFHWLVFFFPSLFVRLCSELWKTLVYFFLRVLLRLFGDLPWPLTRGWICSFFVLSCFSMVSSHSPQFLIGPLGWRQSLLCALQPIKLGPGGVTGRVLMKYFWGEIFWQEIKLMSDSPWMSLTLYPLGEKFVMSGFSSFFFF